MQHFRKIVAFLLSLLVLVSSTPIAFSMHFCMGQLRDVAIYKDAKTCGMETKTSPCEKEVESIKAPDCCEDQTLLIEGQDELSQATPITLSDTSCNAILYALLSLTFNSNEEQDDSTINEYSPPLIKRNIPVLIQSFLI